MHHLEITFDPLSGNFLIPAASTTFLNPQSKTPIHNLLSNLNSIADRPVKSEVSLGCLLFFLYCVTLPVVFYHWQFVFASVMLMMLVVSTALVEVSRWQSFRSEVSKVCEGHQNALGGFYSISNGFEPTDGKIIADGLKISLKVISADQRNDNEVMMDEENGQNYLGPVFSQVEAEGQNQILSNKIIDQEDEIRIVTENRMDLIASKDKAQLFDGPKQLEVVDRPSDLHSGQTEGNQNQQSARSFG